MCVIGPSPSKFASFQPFQKWKLHPFESPWIDWIDNKKQQTYIFFFQKQKDDHKAFYIFVQQNYLDNKALSHYVRRMLGLFLCLPGDS